MENNRALCPDELIPLDPNAPELPPPLEPDSQDNDTPPVYQDITELSCKPNKLVDCDKIEQCDKEQYDDPINDNEITKPQHEKVMSKPKLYILNVYAM